MTPRRNRPRTRGQAAAPLVKPPVRLSLANPYALVRELRETHERYASADSMPDNTELYGALLWAERHSAELEDAPEPVHRKAALDRVRLWQYLREQLDARQAAAIDDARAAGAQWADLVEPLAVKAPSAAYSKAERMRATTLTDPDGRPVRRTPEAVADARTRIARAELAARQREQAAAERRPVVVAVAARLLAHRDQLADDEDAQYWVEEVVTELADGDSAVRQEGLERCLAAVVRALRRYAHTTGRPAATTADALASVAAAEGLPSPDTR